jgi:hypothetical protein
VASTVRWSGPGKQDGKVYVRNQRLNAPQETQQLEPDRSGLCSNAHPHDYVRGTLWPGDVADREVIVNACGVAMTMLQGHSWTPTPLIGWRVNVGTIPLVPDRAGSQLARSGKARCRLMLAGWDGGPVVVRARESRVHGEGVQCVRSTMTDRGVRW